MVMTTLGWKLMEKDCSRYPAELTGAAASWISSLDHAKVGQLMLNKGWWNDREIIPLKNG